MPLVTAEELIKVLDKEGFGFASKPLSRKLMSLLHINQLNDLYTRFKNLPAKEFIDEVLKDLNISYDITYEIPQELYNTTPSIYVANHPLGGIDGLILLRILLERHENIQILTNFLLSRIEPLRPYFCAVNPFETRKYAFSSAAGFRLALKHLNANGSLAIFPAGQVSTLSVNRGIHIKDKEWEMPAIKMVKKSGLPVIPVYFHAKNSNAFYALSSLHSSFRTAALPGEIFKARGSKIHIKFGCPVSPEDIQKIKDLHSLRETLRTKTYTLGNAFRKSSSVNPKVAFEKIASLIKQKQKKTNLLFHIKQLEQIGALVLQSGDYKVFCSKLSSTNPIMLEIGRLREETFQKIGEGTNKKLDIDIYDTYYHHLILWHAETLTVAGAYRLGIGNEIWNTHGMDGFYLSTLFKAEEPIKNMFQTGIELGRAFVAIDFQAKPLPLFLMWKGIMCLLDKNSNIKNIIGAVSISNNFKDESKQTIIAFLNEHYSDKNLKPFVTPINPYKQLMPMSEINQIQNLDQLDRHIRCLEEGKNRLPVLIKKYIMLHANFICFNVDPAFNNAIDGLMYLPVSKINSPILNR